jgi:hypothetical protein
MAASKIEDARTLAATSVSLKSAFGYAAVSALSAMFGVTLAEGSEESLLGVFIQNRFELDVFFIMFVFFYVYHRRVESRLILKGDDRIFEFEWRDITTYWLGFVPIVSACFWFVFSSQWAIQFVWFDWMGDAPLPRSSTHMAEISVLGIVTIIIAGLLWLYSKLPNSINELRVFRNRILLPSIAACAIPCLLGQLHFGLIEHLVITFIMCIALSLIAWGAMSRSQQNKFKNNDEDNTSHDSDAFVLGGSIIAIFVFSLTMNSMWPSLIGTQLMNAFIISILFAFVLGVFEVAARAYLIESNIRLGARLEELVRMDTAPVDDGGVSPRAQFEAGRIIQAYRPAGWDVDSSSPVEVTNNAENTSTKPKNGQTQSGSFYEKGASWAMFPCFLAVLWIPMLNPSVSVFTIGLCTMTYLVLWQSIPRPWRVNRLMRWISRGTGYVFIFLLIWDASTSFTIGRANATGDEIAIAYLGILIALFALGVSAIFFFVSMFSKFSSDHQTRQHALPDSRPSLQRTLKKPPNFSLGDLIRKGVIGYEHLPLGSGLLQALLAMVNMTLLLVFVRFAGDGERTWANFEGAVLVMTLMNIVVIALFFLRAPKIELLSDVSKGSSS